MAAESPGQMRPPQSISPPADLETLGAGVLIAPHQMQNREEIITAGMQQDISQRKLYAKLIYGLVAGWLVFCAWTLELIS